jgi:hypothetical protein
MTNANVGALQDLLNWHAKASAHDWKSLNAVIGVSYPEEFRELVDLFPPGSFQTFLNVLHPDDAADPTEYRRRVTECASLVRDWAADLTDPVGVYPEPGGLLPWATVGFDVVICWLTAGDDPGKWPVVVCESDVDRWNRYDLPTAAFLRAVVTVPTPVVELSYVAEAVQPPVFTTVHELAGARAEVPSAKYWLDGVERGPLVEPSNAVDQLRPMVDAVPIPGFDWYAVLRKMKRALPGDFQGLLTELGGVNVGPAKVSAPDGSATDFFAEQRRLAGRIKAARADGNGPLGTVHPELDGLICWGRLEGGGYLCWVPLPPEDPFEWPVVVLDATLRMSITYKMSASRFLLELATHPERIVLPPAV